MKASLLSRATRSHKHRGQRGSALIVGTIAAGALMAISVALLQFSLRAEDESSGREDDTQARYLAEVALNEAAASLLVGSTGNIGSEADPVIFSDGIFWVEATPLGDQEWLLKTTALAESGRASVEARVRRESEGGIRRSFLSNRKLNLRQDMFVDSYDSALGSYVSQAVNDLGGVAYAGTEGDVFSNGKLKLGKDIYIFGDVLVAPGQSIDGLDKNAHKRHIEGGPSVHTESIYMPPVMMPDLALPNLGKAHVHGDKILAGVDLAIPSGDYRFEEIKIHKDARLTITGPANILVDKKFDFEGDLTIDDSAGRVTFFVGKQVRFKKNTTVLTTSGSASGLFIVMAHPKQYDVNGKKRKSKHKVKIEGTFTGVVYGPDAKIELKKEAEVFGSLMGNEIKMKGGGRFHYDKALERIDVPYGSEGVKVTRVSWRYTGIDNADLKGDRSAGFQALKLDRHALLQPKDTWRPDSNWEPSGEFSEQSPWGPEDLLWDTSESEEYDDEGEESELDLDEEVEGVFSFDYI